MGEMRGPSRHPHCGSKSQLRKRRREEQGTGHTRQSKKAPRYPKGVTKGADGRWAS